MSCSHAGRTCNGRRPEQAMLIGRVQHGQAMMLGSPQCTRLLMIVQAACIGHADGSQGLLDLQHHYADMLFVRHT